MYRVETPHGPVGFDVHVVEPDGETDLTVVVEVGFL